jgi:hypothetical protein
MLLQKYRISERRTSGKIRIGQRDFDFSENLDVNGKTMLN